MGKIEFPGYLIQTKGMAGINSKKITGGFFFTIIQQLKRPAYLRLQGIGMHHFFICIFNIGISKDIHHNHFTIFTQRHFQAYMFFSSTKAVCNIFRVYTHLFGQFFVEGDLPNFCSSTESIFLMQRCKAILFKGRRTTRPSSASYFTICLRIHHSLVCLSFYPPVFRI